MGFSLKKAIGIIAAPVTAPAAFTGNLIGKAANLTGLSDVPIIGNVLKGADSALSVGYDATLGNKDAATVNEGIKNAVLLGGSLVTGGTTLPVVASAVTYGAEPLKQFLGKSNPGVLDALGQSLGIPPGTLSQFLPTSSNAPTRYSGGDSGGGGYIPVKSEVDYGVTPKTNLFPVLAIGGAGLLVTVLLIKKNRR